MLELPTTNESPKDILPKSLAILGKPKTGKSRIVTGLKNYLIIDFEEGDYAYQTSTKKYDSCSICVKPIGNILQGEKVEKYINDPLKPFDDVLDAIKKGGHIYDYLVIDSITRLWDVVFDVATLQCIKEKKDPDNFGARDGKIKDFLRKLNDKLCNYAKHIIYIGHLVDGMVIDKNGRAQKQSKLLVRGNLSETIPSWFDAVGIFETNGKDGFLQFDNTDGSMGSRCKHLTGRRIKISELQEDDSLITFWENIYVKGGIVPEKSGVPIVDYDKVNNNIRYIQENVSTKSELEWMTMINNSTKLNAQEKQLVLDAIQPLFSGSVMITSEDATLSTNE